MSIQEEITRIKNAKTRIANALVDFGKDVPEGSTLDELAEILASVFEPDVPVDPPVIFSFVIEGVDPSNSVELGNRTYQAAEGMTWGEWVESDYNTDGYWLRTVDDVTYIMKDHEQYLAMWSNSYTHDHYISPNEAIIKFEISFTEKRRYKNTLVAPEGVPAVTFEFTIDGDVYQFEYGMNWFEWVESDYNPFHITHDANYLYISECDGWITEDGENALLIRDTTDIVEGYAYSTVSKYLGYGNTRSFKIYNHPVRGNTSHTAISNMTWAAWCASVTCNTGGHYECDDSSVFTDKAGGYSRLYIASDQAGTTLVLPSQEISSGKTYYVVSSRIEFTLTQMVGGDSVVQGATRGMTWGEWIRQYGAAPDQPLGFVILDGKVYLGSENCYVFRDEGGIVDANDVIIAGETYYINGTYTPPELITFTINDVECQAQKDMTWEEWLNSSYYDFSSLVEGGATLAISEGNICNGDGDNLVLNDESVTSTAAIIANAEYTCGSIEELITFSIRGTEVQAEEGMTWEEWLDSSYYTNSSLSGLYSVSGDLIYYNSLGLYVANGDVLVNRGDTINGGVAYSGINIPTEETLITFYISGFGSFQGAENTTWQEWFTTDHYKNSDYVTNGGSLFADGDCIRNGGGSRLKKGSVYVSPDDVIEDGETYTFGSA